MYTLKFLTTGALLTHLFTETHLDRQTDSKTKRQTCSQKKIKVKEASACQKAIACCFFPPVVYKYAWTLATSCHAKTSRNGLHYCASLHKTRSGLVLFISFLISQEKLNVSHAAQPALRSGLCALFITAAIEVQFEEAFIFRRCFPFVVLSHQHYWLLVISDLFCLFCLHPSSFWSPLELVPLGL